MLHSHALFFALLYFVQGFADLSSGLASQPVQYFLKEELALTAGESAFVWAIIGLGWTIKPAYGLLSDFFPLAGYRRKSYLLLMSTLGVGSWLALACLPPHYFTVLCLLTACAATLAFCDVMADALMIETGQPLGLTGSFQAVQWAAISLAFAAAQFAGGYLSASAAPHSVFLLSALFPAVTFLATIGLVREPHPTGSLDRIHRVNLALTCAMQSRTLWTVAGFLVLWNFSPALGTPLLYYQRDVLHFSKEFIGTLNALSNIAGACGAVLFWRYCRHLRLDRLLSLAVALGVASTLGFVLLRGPSSAVMTFIIFGVVSQVAHLAVLDLAARSCPARTEGTVFALLMSGLNIGRTGGTVLGGWLYDHTGIIALILISAGCTALCWLVTPFLKAEFTPPENTG